MFSRLLIQNFALLIVIKIMQIAGLNLLITLIWNGQRLEMVFEYMRLNYLKVGLEPSKKPVLGGILMFSSPISPKNPCFSL